MQSENDITQKDDAATPWYALRLFSIKQQALDDELRERGFTTFIPKQVVDFRDKSNKLRHELRPVVRNLIFLKKAMDEKELRKEIFNFPYKVSVIKKGRDTNEMAEISAEEMQEFQLMCDPKLAEKKFISEESAKLKVGAPVIVTHGPLKGLKGKLVRSNKKYYLLKDIPGIAVMLKVTRWCCQPLEDNVKTKS